MSKAFSLLESLIVLSVVSVCLLISVNTSKNYTSLVAYERLFRSELMLLKQDSLLYNRKNEISIKNNTIDMQHLVKLPIMIDSSSLSINSKGNISNGKTICLRNADNEVCMRIQIGTGSVLVND